jgi:hypothetical protein
MVQQQPPAAQQPASTPAPTQQQPSLFDFLNRTAPPAAAPAAPQVPLTAPPVAPPLPANMDPLLAFLLYNQQQMQQDNWALLESLTSCSSRVPYTPFPTWNGQSDTLPTFLEQLKTLQQDRCFRGADWTKVLPGFEDQSHWLRANILKNLPEQELHQFKNCPESERDGFAMFAALRERLEGNTLEHILRDAMSIATLEQRAGQS